MERSRHSMSRDRSIQSLLASMTAARSRDHLKPHTDAEASLVFAATPPAHSGESAYPNRQVRWHNVSTTPVRSREPQGTAPVRFTAFCGCRDELLSPASGPQIKRLRLSTGWVMKMLYLRCVRKRTRQGRPPQRRLSSYRYISHGKNWVPFRHAQPTKRPRRCAG